MSSESLYMCNRCKKRFNIDNIKFDRWGKLCCVTCLGETEPIEKKRMIIPEPPIQNFICVHCRYKFRIRKGSPKEPACPYCGRKNIMLVKKYKDEDDLIEEASDSKYNF